MIGAYQDRQCAYTVTLLLSWKSSKCYILVCECVRACACERVGARARGRVTLLIHHATRMRHITTSFVASGSTIFFDRILKWIFERLDGRA
jgi:hypothetical protein